MKRTIALIASLSFLFLAFATGQSPDPLREGPVEYTPLAFDETPGAYAIYHDTRAGNDSYIGVCFLGGNELAIRLFEPSTGNELLFTQTFHGSGDSVDPGTISLIRGSFSSSPSTERLIPTITDWASAWLHSRERLEEEPDFTVEGKSMYDFRYWVPVFRMFTFGLEKCDPATGLGAVKLATAGIAQSGDDPAFFEYAGLPARKKGPSFSIEPGASRTATVDGYSVPLDMNWTEGADGIWRVARESPQDAAFLIETIHAADYGDQDVFDLIKMLVLNSGCQLIPDDLRIFVFNECPCVFYRVYDPEGGMVTVQYKMFITRDESRFSMVSLSVFESLYEKNRAYFDSILF